MIHLSDEHLKRNREHFPEENIPDGRPGRNPIPDESESFIDATFASPKGGGEGFGPTKRGKGWKITGIVDRHGLPLAVSTHAASHHEVTRVRLTFDFCMIEAKWEYYPGNFLGFVQLASITILLKPF